MPTAFLNSALSLAARGMRVFPVWGKTDKGCACGTHCASPCKHPLGALVRNGLLDATTDPEVISSWWAQKPGANVGLAAGPESGFWMLDVDGPEGQASLDRLVSENGALPPTLEVKTGKGRHLYFSFIEGLKNNTKVLPGLDIRTAGGYVVAPPSVHASGRVYEFVDPSAKVFPAPLWLLDAIRAKHRVQLPPTPLRATTIAGGTDRYGAAALKALVEELSAVREGGRDEARNGVCFRLGRLVAGGHISRDDAVYGALDACIKNGLVGSESQARVLKRIESGVDDGVQAGPAGPAPEPVRRSAPPREEEREEQRPPPTPPPPRAPVKIPDTVPVPPPEEEHQTDIGNGKRLLRLHGLDIRHVAGWGWVVWDGRRWERDGKKVIEKRAKHSALRLYDELSMEPDPARRELLWKHAKKSESYKALQAAISCAASETRLVAGVSDFDQHPYRLNVRNGTVNLKSGDLLPHRREDLITHLCPVDFDPAAECPTWDAFLERIYAGNQELIRFVQRAFGYTMTGITTEQCLFLLYGLGANGKSTLLRAATTLFGGGYGRTSSFSTFLVNKNPGQYGPRPDLARLAGARFVMAVEPDEGARFSESVVKSITGGDPITAAYKYGDEFEFTPALKLWLSANHKPRITDTSHAMWRRIHLIPHDVTIPKSEQDKKLDDKLAAELPGILNWAIKGCLEWQTFGLEAPEAVQGATAGYRQEQDALAQFLVENTRLDETTWVGATKLFRAYTKWAEGAGEFKPSQTRFGRWMTEKGFQKKNDGSGNVCYMGLALTGEAGFF